MQRARNWKVKEGKYTKSVAKFQGGAFFHVGDIRRIRPRWPAMPLSKTTGSVQEKKKLWFIGVEVKYETRLEI